MQFTYECTHRDSYIWRVLVPFEGMRPYSPTFQYNEYQFRFELCMSAKTFKVYLTSNTDTDYYKFSSSLPKEINVYIENKKRRKFILLPHNCIAEKDFFDEYNRCIWECSEKAILKVIPDLKANILLTFLVTFDASRGSITLLGEPPSIAVPARKALTEKAIQTNTWELKLSLENLSEDFDKLLKGESDWKPDVTLICGDRKLMAHGLVLSTRSEVFAAMLRSDMSEKCSGIVNVKDMDPDDLEDFVRYLYTGKLPDLPSVDFAKRFYVAADRYAVSGLAMRCATFLKQNMNPEDACEMLILADAHSDANLKEFAMDYILEKKMHLPDHLWLSFCQLQPILANEVLNRYCSRAVEP